LEETVYRHPRHDRRAIRPLEMRSDRRGLIQLGTHLAVLALTTAAIESTRGSILMLLAMLVHGIALVFLFSAEHEAIHRTAFRSRWLNDITAWVAGLVLLLPPAYFRYFHFAHHRHTQDPARDPELALPKPVTVAQWLTQVSGWPYWRGQIGLLIAHALGRVTAAYIPERNRAEVILEARIFLAIYLAATLVSIAAWSDVLLVYWIVPALLGQPFLRLYLLAEHTGCPLVPDMLANSRTTLTNAAVRFIAWNMPYHAEHHAYPSVPFHALPDLHRLLRADIGTIARGYLEVQRTLLKGLRRASQVAGAES
jgi:fatty acid desaturase